MLKGRCGVDGFKVGQGLGPQRLSAFTVTSIALVVIAKKQVEIAKVRPSSLVRGCHAAIDLRGRYVGRGEGVQAAHGWRPGLAAKPDPLEVTSTVGTDRMGSDITIGFAEIDTQVLVIRTNHSLWLSVPG